MRVVRAVRAGEAKLRGRMQTVVLIAGPPGCEYPGVVAVSLCLFVDLLRTGAWVLTHFAVFRGLLLVFCWYLHGF